MRHGVSYLKQQRVCQKKVFGLHTHEIGNEDLRKRFLQVAINTGLEPQLPILSKKYKAQNSLFLVLPDHNTLIIYILNKVFLHDKLKK